MMIALSSNCPTRIRPFLRPTPIPDNFIARRCREASFLFHLYAIIFTLPAVLLRPEECEYNFGSRRQRGGWQIQRMDSQACIARVGVMRGVPVIDTPMHERGRKKVQAQRLMARDGAGLVIQSPSEVLPPMLIDHITFHGLRRLIEDFAITNRPPQLDVLRMSPDERAS